MLIALSIYLIVYSLPFDDFKRWVICGLACCALSVEKRGNVSSSHSIDSWVGWSGVHFYVFSRNEDPKVEQELLAL